MNDLVFKISTPAQQATAEAQGSFNGSADDLRDGYIHLSSKTQLAGTLKKYFSGENAVVLTAFEASALGSELRWEKSRDGELFPHYYGHLPMQLRVWSKAIKQSAGGFVLDEDLLNC